MTVSGDQTGTQGNPGSSSDLPGGNGTPVPGQAVSSNQGEVYTKDQVEAIVAAAVHTTRSEMGRDLADVRGQLTDLTFERDGLKSDLERNGQYITDIEKKIEEMSSGDPAKFDAQKEIRNARLLQQRLESEYREKNRAVSKKEMELQPQIEQINEFKAEVLCENIADSNVYEGADANRLKAAIKLSGIKDEAGIRKMADTMWTRKLNVDMTPFNMQPGNYQQFIQGQQGQQQQVPGQNTQQHFPGVTTGGVVPRTPSIEEMRNSTPEQTQAKINSGEWVVKGWPKS